MSQVATKVIKIPEHKIVVKVGCGVTQGEAETQAKVSEILDRTTVFVPRVYHFYRDDRSNVGYLVMEYVEGRPIDIHSTSHVEALKNALNHLASFKRDHPRLLHSGEPQGILWEDDSPSDPHTIEGLKTWIEKWQSCRVDLNEEDLILCHLDTA